jgi:PAS domain S-box-containing protein
MKRETEPTVLVVNDSPDQLALVEALLQQTGYRVFSAMSGFEALELARSCNPNLILSDVSMPEMDGIELCRKIRSDALLRNVPILLVSAHRKDAESAVEGLRAGADDYLEAPYEPMRLIAQVSRLVERARSEEALRESEERFRLTFAQAAVGLAHVNTAGRWVLVNQKLCDIVGYSAEELSRLTFQQITYPGDLGETIANARTLLAGEIENYCVEKRYVRKDGSPVWVELTVSLARDFGGRPKYFIGVIEDISGRKQAEAALKRSEEQLRQSQKLEAIGRLAGGLAHDFNNILTAITGYSDLVLRRLGSVDPLRRSVEEIRRAAERAASLTHQLLAFSRKQMMQVKVLDLNAVVAEMESFLRRLIGEDIQLVTSLDPDLRRVKADPGQIEQVIMNLVVNARDAMPQGGRLRIETKDVSLSEPYLDDAGSVESGDYVVLSIADTGIGMNSEIKQKIFEPFFTTKEEGKGTGLGLAMVYGIVKQSGGSIRVHSEAGAGTTFMVYLPAVEEFVKAQSNGSRHIEAPGGTETVLLVEDEDMVRELVVEVLETEGYTVFSARRGAEALRLCAEQIMPINLLITDVVMPEMSGRELAEHLTARHPEIKVLFISGYTDDAIFRHGVQESNVAFLQKPFTTSELAAKVRSVLDADANRVNRGS